MRLFAIAALFQVFDGVQVVAVGALRGYRDTAVPMLIAAIGYWGFGFPGGWLMAFPLGIGAGGVVAGPRARVGRRGGSSMCGCYYRARAQMRAAAAPALSEAPA